MTQDTTSTSESEDRAVIIISNNEVTERRTTMEELLDNAAERYGVTRLPAEGNLAFAKRILEKKKCP